jgi:plastocyanin
MSDPNRSPRIRFLFIVVLLTVAAVFFLAGYGNALATRSALSTPMFIPLIFQNADLSITATPSPTPTSVVGAGKVSIVDFAFHPAAITVHVGESVEWENTGAMNHTTTSDTGVWNSGTLTPNQKFSFVFNSVGDYPYHCSIHPSMTGIVHVVPNP